MKKFDNFPKPYVNVTIYYGHVVVNQMKFTKITSAMKYIHDLMKIDLMKIDLETDNCTTCVVKMVK